MQKYLFSLFVATCGVFTSHSAEGALMRVPVKVVPEVVPQVVLAPRVQSVVAPIIEYYKVNDGIIEEYHTSFGLQYKYDCPIGYSFKADALFTDQYTSASQDKREGKVLVYVSELKAANTCVGFENYYKFLTYGGYVVYPMVALNSSWLMSYRDKLNSTVFEVTETIRLGAGIEKDFSELFTVGLQAEFSKDFYKKFFLINRAEGKYYTAWDLDKKKFLKFSANIMVKVYPKMGLEVSPFYSTGVGFKCNIKGIRTAFCYAF